MATDYEAIDNAICRANGAAKRATDAKLATMQAQIDRLTALVNKLLDLTAVETDEH